MPGLGAHVAGRAGGDRRDRAGVGGGVALGVGVGARRLAEHVVGVGVALGLERRGRAPSPRRSSRRARTAGPSASSPGRRRCAPPARRRRRIRPRSAAAGRPGSSSSTRPVISSPQVAALTRLEVERPRCAPQFDGSILSAISSSIVSASGTRSSASARHISPTPSSDDRPYSARKASITVGDERSPHLARPARRRGRRSRARAAGVEPGPGRERAHQRRPRRRRSRARIAARGSAVRRSRAWRRYRSGRARPQQRGHSRIRSSRSAARPPTPSMRSTVPTPKSRMASSPSRRPFSLRICRALRPSARMPASADAVGVVAEVGDRVPSDEDRRRCPLPRRP